MLAMIAAARAGRMSAGPAPAAIVMPGGRRTEDAGEPGQEAGDDPDEGG